MPQFTLSVPAEKLPLFNNIFQTLGLKDKNYQGRLSKSVYQTNISGSVTNTSNSFFRKNFDWEYFRNELEFE